MSEIASRVKAIIVDKLGVDENQVTETAAFTTERPSLPLATPSTTSRQQSSNQETPFCHQLCYPSDFLPPDHEAQLR